MSRARDRVRELQVIGDCLAADMRDLPLPGVEARFCVHGTWPAPDDVRITAMVEEHLERWRAVLDSVYAGGVTFAWGRDGCLGAYPRGSAS